MKIVMVGHSGVGKTTYMASMYGALQEPIRGFSVRAEAESDHLELLKLARSVRQGTYPGNTSQRAEYPLRLHFNGRDVLEFLWRDYRGRALRESTDSPQAAQLIDDLREADGILLFCDGEKLSKRRGPDGEVSRMTSLAVEALKGITRAVPLAIVFTKADLLGRWGKPPIGPVESLIDVIKASKYVHGSYVAVACGTRPLHVELPALFALNLGIKVKMNAHAAEAESNRATARSIAAEGNTFWGFLGDAFNTIVGEPTTSERARLWEGWADTEIEQRQALEPAAASLDAYLGGITRF